MAACIAKPLAASFEQPKLHQTKMSKTLTNTNNKKIKGEFNPFDYPEIEKLFGDLLDSLFEESGRGAILIAAAHVDDHLTKIVEAILPKDISKNHKDRLFKYPGQLSSFASKIELAYVFRLIGKNLYDSLNAFRKVRNDAAHSTSKFELHELNDQLKSVYELGPGFANFIKEVSSNALIEQKITALKNAFEKEQLSEDEKQEWLERLFKDKDKIEIMEKQVPFWELVYGLTFLCGLLAHNRLRIEKVTSNIYTIGQIISTTDEQENKPSG